MNEPEKTTKVVQTYDQPVEIQLTRGAKNQYRWSINVKAESPLAALRQVQDIDSELRHRYGVEAGFEPTNSNKTTLPSDPAHARMDQTLQNIKKAGEQLAPGDQK